MTAGKLDLHGRTVGRSQRWYSSSPPWLAASQNIKALTLGSLIQDGCHGSRALQLQVHYDRETGQPMVNVGLLMVESY